MSIEKIKHYFKVSILNHVQKQILLTFVLLTIIPILIFGTSSIIKLRKQMLEHYQTQVSAEVNRVKSTLFDITTSMYTSCEPILSPYAYNALFSTHTFTNEHQKNYTTLSNTLASIHDTTAAISTIQIYTDNPNIPDTAYITYSPNHYVDYEWYKNIDPYSTGWSNWSSTKLAPINNRREESYELTLSRRFILPSTEYSAYLVITISNNYLKNRLLYTDHFILATIDTTPVFFSSNNEWMHSTFPFGEDYKGGYYQYNGPVLLDGKKKFGMISTFAPYKTNVKFYILVADSSTYIRTFHITFTYFIILTIAWFFPTVLIILFSRNLSSRIITLREAMHQASLGDYNIIDSFQGNDELSQIFLDLKSTVNTIKEKETAFYESQIMKQQMINKQQQMEFKMLASQINPHFLYNTLEMIRMQALSKQDRDVANSIKLLGKSMHYVLENTGTNATTLDKELDYIKNYLSIQQLRFGNRVNYSFDIDPSIKLSQCKILPLLIQPIVENAVSHGLEGIKNNGQITISIHALGTQQIQIAVSDNGDGMTDEALQTLYEHINSKNGEIHSSIGLYNINQRIKLLYGEEYSLHISSKLHHGTCVTLLLPQNYVY